MAMINGGTAFNVIPDSATIAGTYRAFSKKSFYALRERIEEVGTNLGELDYDFFFFGFLLIGPYMGFELGEYCRVPTATHAYLAGRSRSPSSSPIT